MKIVVRRLELGGHAHLHTTIFTTAQQGKRSTPVRQVRHHAGMPSDATPDEVASLDVAVEAGSSAVRVDDDFATLVLAYAPLTAVPLVPELQLHRTTDMYGLWETTAEPAPPFWAVPWAGGQALARYLLDNPHVVRGRRVLDVGAGSGLVAIAAARAGADTVIAADIDPNATAVISMNAQANDVLIEAVLEDPLDGDGGDAELVLAGDTFYERVLAGRMTAFLDRVVRRSTTALVGDLGRAYLPKERLRSITAYDVPVTADIEDTATKPTTVWRFELDS